MLFNEFWSGSRRLEAAALLYLSNHERCKLQVDDHYVTKVARFLRGRIKQHTNRLDLVEQ